MDNLLLDYMIKELNAPSYFGIFDLMPVAEEEIESFEQKYKNKKDLIHNSFKILCPSSAMRDFSNEDLYRAHCRELLWQVVNGQDTALITKAEVICLLSNTSLKAPLTHDATGLMVKLWYECGLPELPIKPQDFHESYNGVWDELYIDASNQLKIKDRRIQR